MKLPEDLSPNYRKKLETMTETEVDIHRARTADSVYYSGVRKKVKMSDAYLCASEEMRQRLMDEALKEAQCRRYVSHKIRVTDILTVCLRHNEKRTWIQKAEAKGFTRNANGEWEQDLDVLRKYNTSLFISTSNTCENDNQEKEISRKSNQGLASIMVVLSELGGNLNMGELQCVQRKVEDLMRAEEERNESYDFGSPAKTQMPTYDMAVMGQAKTGTDREPAEEKRKRKLPSDFESAGSDREKSCSSITPISDKGRPGRFRMSHTPGGTPEIRDTRFDSEIRPAENPINATAPPEDCDDDCTIVEQFGPAQIPQNKLVEQSELLRETANVTIDHSSLLREAQNPAVRIIEQTRLLRESANTAVEHSRLLLESGNRTMEETGLFQQSANITNEQPNLIVETGNTTIERPVSITPVEVIRTPTGVDKEVKVENAGSRKSRETSSKPVRTGFFDNVKWN